MLLVGGDWWKVGALQRGSCVWGQVALDAAWWWWWCCCGGCGGECFDGDVVEVIDGSYLRCTGLVVPLDAPNVGSHGRPHR